MYRQAGTGVWTGTGGTGLGSIHVSCGTDMEHGLPSPSLPPPPAHPATVPYHLNTAPLPPAATSRLPAPCFFVFVGLGRM